MSRRLVVLVLVVAGCGGEFESGGPAAGDPEPAKVSAITGGNGHDYYFFQNQKNWTSARTVCASMSTHLVSIGDAGENTWVLQQIAQHGGTSAWWIGRSDSVFEGFWMWDGGGPNSFNNWFAGEPNNFGNEDCATMDTATGKWNDVNCVTQFNFVCEREGAARTTPINFVYSGNDTNSATRNFSVMPFAVTVNQVVTIGTCGIPGATNNGTDTFLRLFAPDNSEQLAWNDDSCGGLGSNLSFQVFTTGTYIVRAGCYGDSACNGTVRIRTEP